ncbi:MAG: Gfo/Idh/MocA family oxidoreductase, partial [Myxococcota bacterium]|nr:Gfo/Idh/MocA family oxidoreductase [Myxococcota bacterium]
MAVFGMLGAAGFVAPRHMKAIHQTGNRLVAACDPYDGVGILDRYFPSCRFFTEVERFDRHLEKLRRGENQDAVDYISICSPNYLHDAHCRLAMRLNADAICEKPLVVSPWNLDQLEQLEEEYEGKVYTILQLRLHHEAQRLKRLVTENPNRNFDCNLSYVTRRGQWYHQSWKGRAAKSGGLSMNIGIHFFDLLIWLFGGVQKSVVTERTETKFRGELVLERATVRWFLSIDVDDLPSGHLERGLHAHRSLSIGDDGFDFSSGFDDLHTRVYEQILDGKGFGITDARPSIELVHSIRTCP